MDKNFEILKKKIIAGLENADNSTDEQIESVIEECSFETAREQHLGLDYIVGIIKKLKSELLGFGSLQEMFDDPGISEIMVNGKSIFYERNGCLSKADVELAENSETLGIIRTICRKTGRSVNTAVPITDACLSDGTRINIVMEPVCVDGNTITIRKFPKIPLSAGNLIKNGMCTCEAMDFLKNAYKSRYNMFICGGAGTGKTTLLNVLANFTNKNERLITIEDSAELRINGVENLVRLETRHSNSEGKGEVTIRDLIRTSLRMRPDRIIVGEVRGAEAFDMLQAMNTGHEGSVSTGHANSAGELVSRLESMVIMDRDMPVEAARQQIVMAIDIIVCISRPGGIRRITEICEMAKSQSGFELNCLFAYDYQKKCLMKKNELHSSGKMLRYLNA